MRFAALIFATLFFALVAFGQTPESKPTSKPSEAPKAATEKKSKEKKEDKTAEKVAAATADPKLPANPKTLIIEDLTPGTGKSAAKGKTVKVHYTGWIYDSNAPSGMGKQLDSSHKRGEPFSFVLGGGQVIKGWEEGIHDMKVGGKRRLIIPSDLAYGKRGARTEVPPDTNLVYEVELVDVIDTM